MPLCRLQVSMNEMMESIKKFDNKELPIRHIPGPEGVRGRNSDNELILEKLGWEPTIRLNDGLKLTYDWIKKQLAEVSALLCTCWGRGKGVGKAQRVEQHPCLLGKEIVELTTHHLSCRPEEDLTFRGM